jgi:hypothetical protein
LLLLLLLLWLRLCHWRLCNTEYDAQRAHQSRAATVAHPSRCT